MRTPPPSLKLLGVTLLLGWAALACNGSPTEVCPGPFALDDPGVTPPTRLFAPAPEYTEEARRARVQGIVLAEGVVSCDGSFTDLRIVRSLCCGLDEATLDALSRWRFSPAARNGSTASVVYPVTVTFRLQ